MITNQFYISDNLLSSFCGYLIYENKKDAPNSSAFLSSEKINILIKIPRCLGITSVNLTLFDESCYTQLIFKNAKWIKIDSSFDVYKISLNSRDLGIGLFFYDVELDSICGKIYAQKQEDRLFFVRKRPNHKFQITISEFIFEKPIEVYGGIIYHIFVDRFAIGKKHSTKKNSMLNWDSPIPEYPLYPGAPIKNDYFYGGDLWGISEKLNYLKELGVSIIYLSPIFESPSNHKYDTSNYMKVDEGFGGDVALIDLIKKAAQVGISIILDGVFNHTGADSLYFNKYNRYAEIGAYNSKDSKYFEWYDFESYPDKYKCWWGIDILPRINPDIASAKSFITGPDGVLDKYMKLGILGFRLDVADELSDDLIQKIKHRLNIHNKHSYLIGEVWEDASNKIAYNTRKRYYLGSEIDGVMNYPIRDGIIDFLRNNNSSKLKYALTEVTFNAPKRIRDSQMNIIGTHDTERIITALAGANPVGKSNDCLSKLKMSDYEYNMGKKKLLMAYTLLATIPGIPSIYYGDEVGLEGYSDPFNRQTFPWNKIDHAILSHYKLIGKIRRENNIYAEGKFILHHLDNEIVVFSRYDNKHSYVTILNNTSRNIYAIFSRKSRSLFTNETGNLFTIDSLSSLVIKADKNSTFELKNKG